MPPTDAHALYRWMWLCFDAGVAYARGSSPLPMEAGDAAIVTIVRADWRLRMRETVDPEPSAPAWLAQLQEAHTPEPWGES
jgi:hypothetical protein